MKPVIYVANMDEEGVMDPENNAFYQAVLQYAQKKIAKSSLYALRWKKNYLP